MCEASCKKKDDIPTYFKATKNLKETYFILELPRAFEFILYIFCWCTYCHINQELLEAIIMASLNQNPPKCEICDKVGNLKSHINYVHKYDQKDNKCGSCEKAFTQVGDLKKHISHSSYWSKRS